MRMMGVTVRRLCPIFRTWTSVCPDLPTELLNKVILQFYILRLFFAYSPLILRLFFAYSSLILRLFFAYSSLILRLFFAYSPLILRLFSAYSSLILRLFFAYKYNRFLDVTL